MASRAALQQNDFDGDSTVVGFATDEITDTNIVSVSTAFGAFRAAVEAVTLGVSIQSGLTIESQFASSKTKAANSGAKRGNKWLVTFEDNQQWLDAPTNTIPNPNYRETFQITIGCADLSLRTNNSEIVYAPTGTWDAAFVDLASKCENIVRSKFGTTGTVVEIRAVTVNLS